MTFVNKYLGPDTSSQGAVMLNGFRVSPGEREPRRPPGPVDVVSPSGSSE